MQKIIKKRKTEFVYESLCNFFQFFIKIIFVFILDDDNLICFTSYYFTYLLSNVKYNF